jgi:hypothetical protein
LITTSAITGIGDGDGDLVVGEHHAQHAVAQHDAHADRGQRADDRKWRKR